MQALQGRTIEDDDKLPVVPISSFDRSTSYSGLEFSWGFSLFLQENTDGFKVNYSYKAGHGSRVV
jgi:hypothetical protein